MAVSDRKKERWTESEVIALPAGEHDYFERKSGALLQDSGFRGKLAKAVSAFANSGGGSLVIGVRDDGTIDGVPKTRSSKTSTRDWIEQIIQNLVSYPLQDFRVHEVEPESPSLIPTDHVVVVIDIGDSMLAPHQSAGTGKTYYYRAGGRSEPAPHHFLEMLRGRDRYPSQRIAYAWLNFVIAPWLNRLEAEQGRLSSLQVSWNRSSRTMDALAPLNPSSAVETQFLKSYGTIQESIVVHDAGLNLLRDKVDQLVNFIENDNLLAHAYARATSSESIKEIRRNNPYLDSQYGSSDVAMMNGLFGTMSKEEQFSFLTQLIVNQRGDVPRDMVVWPLWNSYGGSFRKVLHRYPISEGWQIVNRAIEAQLRNTAILVEVVHETRHELSFKYGEPYEDQTLLVSSASPHRKQP
jgi:hypothetical protein